MNQECYITTEEARLGCEKNLAYSIKKKCDQCGGTGKKGLFKCKPCRGTGQTSAKINITIVVPPGTEGGTALSYSVQQQDLAHLLPDPFSILASVREEGESSLPEVFDQLFNQAGPLPKRGDIYQSVDISSAEAMKGCSRVLSCAVKRPCGSCGGTGEAVKGESEHCTKCDGKGTISIARQNVFGTITTHVRCEKCGGMGRIIKKPCSGCEGKGYVEIKER